MGESRREISLLRTVAKVSPGEISAEQFHTWPQLQGLCLLRRAKRAYELASTVSCADAWNSGADPVPSHKAHFCHNVWAMCWSLGVFVCCMSCAFAAVVREYDT